MAKLDQLSHNDNEWPQIEIDRLRSAIERIERLLIFDKYNVSKTTYAAISECRSVLNI